MTQPLPADLEPLSRPRLRFVQNHGQRRAIRIEEGYWQCLEAAASELGIRLNRLVDLVTGANTPERNVSALLRLFCVNHLTASLRRERLRARSLDVGGLVSCANGPCFAVGPDLVVACCNPALEAWADAAAPVVGSHLNRYFRLKLRVAMSEIWGAREAGPRAVHGGTIMRMGSGHTEIRRVKACQVQGDPEDRSFLVIFVQ